MIANPNQNLPKRIALQDSDMGIMALKSERYVLRLYHSYKYKDHEHFYSDMLLFKPWRNEEELFASDSVKCEKLWTASRDCITMFKRDLLKFANEVQEMSDIQERNIVCRPSHLIDNIDAANIQENDDDLLEGEILDEESAIRNPGDLLNFPSNDTGNAVPEKNKYHKINSGTIEIMKENVRKLVPEQRIVFDMILKQCKALSRRTVGGPIPESLRLIVHGGAGCGKSALINAIAQWVDHILPKAGEDVDKPRILLTAYAGMAACLIGGQTLHSAFNFGFQTQYTPLGKNLDKVRDDLSNLQFLVIDEMSFVSSDFLYMIHMRLVEIFGLHRNTALKPFAGINVILVGDLLQLKPV